MTTLLLNIGLHGIPTGQSSTNGQANPWIAKAAMTAAQALRREGFVYGNNAVRQSDTEPTLVIEVTFTGNSGVNGHIRRVAQALNQTCIAVWKDRHGVMLGRDIDHDDALGEFDPAKFVMVDGRRLSQHLLEKAAA